MKSYTVLACDFDGTLATNEVVSEAVLSACAQLKDSGRRLVLVTGRTLPSLLVLLRNPSVFDCIVAENGALIFTPSTGEKILLAEPTNAKLLAKLSETGVQPLEHGDCIIGTWTPHDLTALAAIHELGLEMSITYNREAVMILPSGINKGTGLRVALQMLGCSQHNCVGIGDGENDHAMLSLCELSIAVSNSVPSLLTRADYVTKGAASDGVMEVITALIQSDLREFEPKSARHHISIGIDLNGKELRFDPATGPWLITGPSGTGKTMIGRRIAEGLSQSSYQLCLLDPEDEFGDLTGATILGSESHVVDPRQVQRVLEHPGENVVVSLSSIKHASCPDYLQELLTDLQSVYERYGRPHWLFVEEAHYFVPAQASISTKLLAEKTIFTTYLPGDMDPEIVGSCEHVIVTGAHIQYLSQISNAVVVPAEQKREDTDCHFLYWNRRTGETRLFRPLTPSHPHRRHVRKYTDGDVGSANSFYFRGAHKKLNLKAHNLKLFLQMADGVDDETWFYHLRKGDYSRWFRHTLKDENLALEMERIEQDTSLSSQAGREVLHGLIERRYAGNFS
jgi:HAD superfamily hydrolase (TIGR01484 family)